MIQTISDKIESMLTTLVGTGKPFKSVFDYHTLEQTGYPYICFELTEFDAEIQDSCNNKRTYTFTILILQEIPTTAQGGRGKAVNIIVKALDDVIAMFDENFTLDGTVSNVIPLGGNITPATLQSGKVLVGGLQLQVETIAFIK